MITAAGRICLSFFFLFSALHAVSNWSEVAEDMGDHGIPGAEWLFLPVIVLMQVAGGLSLLIGFRARTGALLLIVQLAPMTLIYDAFWSRPFLMDLGLIGGLLMVMQHGAGRLSYDDHQKVKHARRT